MRPLTLEDDVKILKLLRCECSSLVRCFEMSLEYCRINYFETSLQMKIIIFRNSNSSFFAPLNFSSEVLN